MSDKHNDIDQKHKVIGHSVPRIDGPEKVTGAPAREQPAEL